MIGEWVQSCTRGVNLIGAHEEPEGDRKEHWGGKQVDGSKRVKVYSNATGFKWRCERCQFLIAICVPARDFVLVTTVTGTECKGNILIVTRTGIEGEFVSVRASFPQICATGVTGLCELRWPLCLCKLMTGWWQLQLFTCSRTPRGYLRCEIDVRTGMQLTVCG